MTGPLRWFEKLILKKSFWPCQWVGILILQYFWCKSTMITPTTATAANLTLPCSVRASVSCCHHASLFRRPRPEDQCVGWTVVDDRPAWVILTGRRLWANERMRTEISWIKQWLKMLMRRTNMWFSGRLHFSQWGWLSHCQYPWLSTPTVSSAAVVTKKVIVVAVTLRCMNLEAVKKNCLVLLN